MTKPFQFRLSTLLIATTTVAILAACAQIPVGVFGVILALLIVITTLGSTTFAVLAAVSPFRKDLATGPRIVVGCLLVLVILVAFALAINVMEMVFPFW